MHPGGCVAPPSNTPGILFVPPYPRAAIGAKPAFHHGLLASALPDLEEIGDKTPETQGSCGPLRAASCDRSMKLFATRPLHNPPRVMPEYSQKLRLRRPDPVQRARLLVHRSSTTKYRDLQSRGDKKGADLSAAPVALTWRAVKRDGATSPINNPQSTISQTAISRLPSAIADYSILSLVTPPQASPNTPAVTFGIVRRADWCQRAVGPIVARSRHSFGLARGCREAAEVTIEDI